MKCQKTSVNITQQRCVCVNDPKLFSKLILNETSEKNKEKIQAGLKSEKTLLMKEHYWNNVEKVVRAVKADATKTGAKTLFRFPVVSIG